jgi:tetratricopeptide (TPR) repeat protein
LTRLALVASLAGLAALAAPAAPAWAQSRRYPPAPKDPDREAAHHSKVWEDALDPGRAPYERMLRDARQLADDNSIKDRQAAIAMLDDAVKLLPARFEAYALRGEIQLSLKSFAACADDLAAADRYAPPDETPERARLRVELGICQGRAGRFADAERTLARAASMPNARGDAWMRLGEVRIALGKLDEAIGALDTAAEVGDVPIGFMQFLLASAYDRARLPGEAAAAMASGKLGDSSFGSIETPQYPLLGAGEHEYLMALAYLYAQPRPEYALLYFRRFVVLAPDSPWRRRAEEHLRELSSSELPQTVERRSGTAVVDVEAVRAALAHVMPAMRACMAKLPGTALEVSVTRDGPRSPLSRDRARYTMPPQATTVQDLLEPPEGVARDDVDAAQRCIEPLVERAALPVPKDHDTYYKVSFLVISP